MIPSLSLRAVLMLSAMLGAASNASAQDAAVAADTSMPATASAAPAPAPVAPGEYRKGPGSPFSAGNLAVYGSLHLGGFAGGYGRTSIPPLAAGLDYFMDQNIALGGVIGFSQSTYDYGFLSDTYDWTYTYVLIGFRGAYHFHEIVPDLPLDPYVGLTGGYNIVTVSGRNSSSASGSYTVFGGHIGARYWFNPKLAAQLELGYGMGVLGLGITYRL